MPFCNGALKTNSPKRYVAFTLRGGKTIIVHEKSKIFAITIKVSYLSLGWNCTLMTTDGNLYFSSHSPLSTSHTDTHQSLDALSSLKPLRLQLRNKFEYAKRKIISIIQLWQLNKGFTKRYFLHKAAYKKN